MKLLFFSLVFVALVVSLVKGKAIKAYSENLDQCYELAEQNREMLSKEGNPCVHGCSRKCISKMKKMNKTLGCCWASLAEDSGVMEALQQMYQKCGVVFPSPCNALMFF